MATEPIPTNGHATPEVPRESSLQEYLTIILRGKWIILLATALVIGATAFYTFRTRPDAPRAFEKGVAEGYQDSFAVQAVSMPCV